MDWVIHRIAANSRYSSSLLEVQTLWSIDDIYDAHDVLDMFDE